MRTNEGSHVDQIKAEISEVKSELWGAVSQFSVLQLAILIMVLKAVSIPYSCMTRAIVPILLAILLTNGSLGISIIHEWATIYKDLLNQLDEAKDKHGAALARNRKRRNVIMSIFMGFLLVYAFLIFGYIVLVAYI